MIKNCNRNRIDIEINEWVGRSVRRRSGKRTICGEHGLSGGALRDRRRPIGRTFMQYIFRYRSPLGGMTMINDGKALTGLWFDRQRYFGVGMSEACEEKALPVFLRTKEWLDGYFAGEAPRELPPISTGCASPLNHHHRHNNAIKTGKFKFICSR